MVREKRLTGITTAFLIVLIAHSFAFGQDMIRSLGTAAIHGKAVDVARDKAIDNALRNAVEEKVGVMVSGITEVENFQVKLDQILSQSKGFVKHYRIVSEDREGDVYKVTVEAAVETGLLKDRLEAVELIMARKDKPRLMIVLKGREKGDAAVEAIVSRFFIEQGFKVVDLSVKTGPAVDFQALTANTKALSAVAHSYGAEVVVLLAVEDMARTFKMGDIEVTSHEVTLSNKVVNGDTGDVITTGSITEKGDFKTAVERVSLRSARLMRDKILERWSQELTNTVTVKLQVEGLRGYEDLAEFKELIRGQVKGLRRVHQRVYSQGVAELDLEVRGTTQGVAPDLETVKMADRKVVVTDVTANRISVKITQ
ncbi:MAG: flagellar assembly protein T N-terminal domain-containing protein [Syntrophales bacterium]|nr:flagellar assembly protein T N-terminal domain-containing protein [Syntrophales bacterium]